LYITKISACSLELEDGNSRMDVKLANYRLYICIISVYCIFVYLLIKTAKLFVFPLLLIIMKIVHEVQNKNVQTKNLKKPF